MSRERQLSLARWSNTGHGQGISLIKDADHLVTDERADFGERGGCGPHGTHIATVFSIEMLLSREYVG